MLDKTLNIRGTLTSLATLLVMGILNITPDSFWRGQPQTDRDRYRGPYPGNLIGGRRLDRYRWLFIPSGCR